MLIYACAANSQHYLGMGTFKILTGNPNQAKSQVQEMKQSINSILHRVIQEEVFRLQNRGKDIAGNNIIMSSVEQGQI